MTENPLPQNASSRRAPTARRLKVLFEQLLSATRVVVVAPVIVLILAALGAFAYGTWIFGESVQEVIAQPLPVGHKIGFFLLVVDLFLIGATLLIAAFGFYELFISRIEGGGETRMPAWLEMRDLNDLKTRVIAMIVLVAGVTFVELVVDAGSGLEALELGGGVALVVVALTVFIRLGGGHRGDHL